MGFSASVLQRWTLDRKHDTDLMEYNSNGVSNSWD